MIASESRPGGNVTGLLFRIEGLTGKQIELARELIPNMAKIGLLVNVASGVIIDRQEAESACQRLGIEFVPAEVRAPNDLDTAFQALANNGVQAVIVLVDGCYSTNGSGSPDSQRPRSCQPSAAFATMSMRAA